MASAQVATGALADPEYRLAHEYGVRVGMTTLSFNQSMPSMNITREQVASFAAGFAGPEGMVDLDRNPARNCTFSDIALADATLVGQIVAACEFGMLR